MKLLIAYDGTEGADDSIRDLARAGLSVHVSALVLSVADGWPPLPPSSFDPDGPISELSPIVWRAHAIASKALADAREVAGRGAARIREHFPAWAVAPETATGSPPAVLVERAEKWAADLLIVGARAGPCLDRLMLGSVSQKVLACAGCSVRIARAPRSDDSPPRLVIGFDGSEDAEAAVRAVAARAWPPGTAVRVVTAVDLRLATMVPAARAMELAVNEDDGSAWVRQAASRAAAALCASGLDAESIVREAAEPKRVLLQEVEDWAADCVFVGAKGHGRWERFLLGSVSAAVAARAQCSVEVVR